MGLLNSIKRLFGFGKPKAPQSLPNFEDFLKSEENRRAKERAANRYNRPVQPNRMHGVSNPARRNDGTDYLSSQAPVDNFLPGYIVGSMINQDGPMRTSPQPPAIDLPDKPDYQQPETPQRAEPSYPSIEREVSSYTPEPASHSYSDHSSSYSSSSDSGGSYDSGGSSGGDSGGGSCGCD